MALSPEALGLMISGRGFCLLGMGKGAAGLFYINTYKPFTK